MKSAVKCDAILAISKYILDKVILQRFRKKAFLIFDGYEHSGKKWKHHNGKKRLKLVFVSNNVYSVFPQIKYLPKNVSLTIIGPPERRVKKYLPNEKMFTNTPYKFKYLIWNRNTVHDEILKCDVGVIPYPDKHIKRVFTAKKSNNRLVLFMSLGLPVIVSPAAEYLPIVKQGQNGFLARTSDEWIKYIELLRDNPRKRFLIGKQARLTVLNRFSLEEQGKLYLRLFKRLLKES